MANTKSLWLRLYTEILNDPKVQRLPDSLFRGYILLLCIAKEYGSNGELPLQKDIAFFLRCPPSRVKMLCDSLHVSGLLEYRDGTYSIHNWNDRQYESDNDPTANMRKRRQRERDKIDNVTRDVTDMSRVTSRSMSQNVTRTETETETEIEIEKEEDKREKPQAAAALTEKSYRFSKPTLEEVSAYCAERSNGINAQSFIDYYESNGWKVGRSAMKDWRAAVRNWERREGGGKKNLRVLQRTACLDMAETL